MRHWKHSKFVKWVRGYEKPYALTWDGWDEWNRETRAKYPVRFWFAEDFVPAFQRVVTWPYKKLCDIKYYINNRWVTRSHALTSTLTPGKWYDMDTRLLNCMFDELVNFVEVEQARMLVCWDSDAHKKHAAPRGLSAWLWSRSWRCPAAGIERLEWAAGLEENNQPTDQALGAKEILDLYRWWKDRRPQRRDPMEVSGWSKLCEHSDGSPGLHGVPRDIKDASMKVMNELEGKYNREDEQMMIRLIKVRRHLWT